MSSSKFNGSARLLVKIALPGLDVVDRDLNGLTDKFFSEESMHRG